MQNDCVIRPLLLKRLKCLFAFSILLCGFHAPGAADFAGQHPLIADLAAGKHGAVTSILIRHKGRMVAEHYFAGTDRGTRHDIRSATKSITSLAVGISVDRGLLKGPKERVFERLADRRQLTDDAKREITLEDLLTMRSGLACDDWVPASLGHEDKMYRTHDWLAFWSSLPVSHERGKHYSYCTGNVMAAAALVEGASKLPFDRFADRYLLSPLGIRDAVWAKAPNGAIDAGGHLLLTSRELLAIGELVLAQGRVGRRQIVSEAWIAKSTSAVTAVYERRQKYGYFWWVDDFSVGTTGRSVRGTFAWGNGGTYIFIVPEFELVVVFTGKNFNSRLSLQPQNWMSSDILPAFAPAA